MPQLKFLANFNYQPYGQLSIVANTMSFFGMNIWESISLNTFNFGVTGSSNVGQKATYNIGLYSLSGSTLILINSGSTSLSTANWNAFARYIPVTTWSSASYNIVPGTWFWGFLCSTSSAAARHLLFCDNGIPPAEAFPNSFIGGVMTESTSALPASIGTSVLTTGGTGTNSPMFIILSA